MYQTKWIYAIDKRAKQLNYYIKSWVSVYQIPNDLPEEGAEKGWRKEGRLEGKQGWREGRERGRGQGGEEGGNGDREGGWKGEMEAGVYLDSEMRWVLEHKNLGWL